MLLIPQILVRTFALGASAVALLACGQQGPLYLPQTGAAHRATLPESLVPAIGNPQNNLSNSQALPAVIQPATTASAPQHQ
ncbi:MAG: hypothetical protein CVU24_06875 [Betaproteobacteria bacterium HGW-Betaproteobacteria-18]|nr:MAG: hypothetical protein CVU24_06875 [Betaproteobacteria bacterium HGW-Betaproteobacteria-18]